MRLRENGLHRAALEEWLNIRMGAHLKENHEIFLRASNGAFFEANTLRLTTMADRLMRETGPAILGLVADHPLVLNAIRNRAIADGQAGRFLQAFECLDDLDLRMKTTSTEEHRRLAPTLGLVRLNLLTEMGDYSQAQKVADRLLSGDEAATDPQILPLIRHTAAIIDVESGNPQKGAADLMEVCQDLERTGGPGAWSLAALLDLANAHIVMDQPDGVWEVAGRVAQILQSTPCTLNALDIGRLTVLDAALLGLIGELRQLRFRLDQIRPVLEAHGRGGEARRSIQRILEFTSRHGGSAKDLKADRDPLSLFLNSRYVRRDLYENTNWSAFCVQVESVGERLAEGVDLTVLTQAAAVPFGERSERVRRLASGFTGLPHCPVESKVLAVLYAYHRGLQRHPYSEVLIRMWSKRGVRLDEGVVSRLLALHAS